MTPAEVVRAFHRCGCTVFLDGRNEHGTHVIPGFPASLEHKDVEAALEDCAERVMTDAEKLGYKVGDTVWVNFDYVRGDRDDGFYGYYEYASIDAELSRLIHTAWHSKLLAQVRPRVVAL